MTSLDTTSIRWRAVAALAAAAVLATLAAAGSPIASAAAPTSGPPASGLGPGGFLDLALGRSVDGGRRARTAVRSRGHGFVRDARGFGTLDVPGATYTAVS